MKPNQNMMILKKLIIYKTKSIVNNIIKVPSYLIDMVLIENKKIMLMKDETTIITLDKESINDKIIFAETRQYKGKLNKKDIEYHLVHIKTLIN